jgi:hypothetical protein
MELGKNAPRRRAAGRLTTVGGPPPVPALTNTIALLWLAQYNISTMLCFISSSYIVCILCTVLLWCA